MPASFDPELFASRLVKAHRTHVPLDAATIAAAPQSLEHAYAVQRAVMAGLGANGGFKTARPDPAGPNVMAPIPAAHVRPSPARFTEGEMRLVGIEIEIAFRIDAPLPALAAADYDDQLRAAVSVLPAIELVDTRLADRDAAGDFVKLADNNTGFGLVTGAPIKDFAALDLTHPEVSFTVNGRQIGSTQGQIPGTVDAFGVLKNFLAVVGDHCGGPAPGMYVTTGSLSGLHWAAHGDEIAGSVAGLGEVAVIVE